MILLDGNVIIPRVSEAQYELPNYLWAKKFSGLKEIRNQNFQNAKFLRSNLIQEVSL